VGVGDVEGWAIQVGAVVQKLPLLILAYKYIKDGGRNGEP
jgi:hypothetical protein